MKSEFYTLKYNNIIIATSHSMAELESLLVKLKQNPKQAKDLVQQKRIINSKEEFKLGNQIQYKKNF